MKTSVINSRTHKKHPQTWRRRQCTKCKRIFTSYEKPDSSVLSVTDEAGSLSNFNLGKLILSIAKAFQHDKFQAQFNSFDLALTVEAQLISSFSDTANSSKASLTTKDIKQVTYQTLKLFDELASTQYAMQHGMITSVRRRGRPSTTATTYENDAVSD